jgi:hypothetical protein
VTPVLLDELEDDDVDVLTPDVTLVVTPALMVAMIRLL